MGGGPKGYKFHQ